MNNPFGIPDELFEQILATAVAQSVGGKNVPPRKTAPTTDQMIEKGAKSAKRIYDSYVKVGFTDKQAFDLLKCVLTKNN